MASVTQRIKQVKQPYGGYIKPSNMKKIVYEDGEILNPSENIPASTIGLVIDYMTRFLSGKSVKEAFEVSLVGADMAEIKEPGSKKNAINLAKNIRGLDDLSIKSACSLVTYDHWARSALDAMGSSTEHGNMDPDLATIQNIKIMINRSVKFIESYQIVSDGFTFSPNGYSEVVTQGDGDYILRDTSGDFLIDFKVTKSQPTSKHTLQILMYYLMGKHSGNPMFSQINKIGLFNPRLNILYEYKVADLSQETIEAVENTVICYGKSLEEVHQMKADELLERKAKGDGPQTYTPQETADLLGLNRNIIYTMIKSGDLPAEKKGNRYVITDEGLDVLKTNLENARIAKKRETLIAVIVMLIMLVICAVYIFILMQRML